MPGGKQADNLATILGIVEDGIEKAVKLILKFRVSSKKIENPSGECHPWQLIEEDHLTLAVIKHIE